MKFQYFESSQNMLAAQMDSMAEVASDHESRVTVKEKTLNHLKMENTCLHTKVNDLEGRCHCNNIKNVGIPEGKEKCTLTEFISPVIPKLLGKFRLLKRVIINRVYCTPTVKASRRSQAPHIYCQGSLEYFLRALSNIFKYSKTVLFI